MLALQMQLPTGSERLFQVVIAGCSTCLWNDHSVDLAKVEWDQLSTQVAPLRLRIVDVAADGNCA